MVSVINIKNAPKDWEKDSNYQYIGRAGKGMDGYFGNPFPVPGNRLESIERYREYFESRIKSDPEFKEKILSLRNKILVCFCKPLACHGDVISEYLRRQS